MKRTPWNKSKSCTYQLDLSNNVCHDKFVIEIARTLGGLVDYSQYPNEYKIYSAVSNYYNVPVDNIAIGHGSGEIMSRLINLYKNKSWTIVSPTWQLPEVLAEIQAVDYSLDYNPKADVLYVASPNGQDGQDVDYYDMISNHQLVIIDEAYNEWSDAPSIVNNIPENVVVLKTLSKSLGLAGVRLGYAFANEKIIHNLQQIRPNYISSAFVSHSINILLSMIPQHVERMKKTRDYIENNYDCVPSKANFVLFKNPPEFINQWKTKKLGNLTRMSLFDLKDFIDAENS